MTNPEIPRPESPELDVENDRWGLRLAEAKAAREATSSSGVSGRVELHDFNLQFKKGENIIPTDDQCKP